MSGTEHQRAKVKRLIEMEPDLGRAQDGSGAWLGGLCKLAVRTLPATGVGISVMSGRPDTPSLSTASDVVSGQVEDLQFVLGEGPCLEAYTARKPVVAVDLGLEASGRWPAYSPAAQNLGVRAVFAFPMQVGSARLGVLDVYQDQPGALSEPAMAMAQVFADAAMTSLLAGQQAAGQDRSPEALEDALHHRMEVYQAQGMVQVQLEVSTGEAMLRLRAYAFAAGRSISEVAADIVSRRLKLQRDNE